MATPEPSSLTVSSAVSCVGTAVRRLTAISPDGGPSCRAATSTSDGVAPLRSTLGERARVTPPLMKYRRDLLRCAIVVVVLVRGRGGRRFDGGGGQSGGGVAGMVSSSAPRSLSWIRWPTLPGRPPRAPEVPSATTTDHVMSSSRASRHLREADLEAGAAAWSILDPRLAAVGVGVFGDERPDPRPVPTRCRAALPRANRSKMRARSPRATPGPASSTDRAIAVPAVPLDLTRDGSAGVFAGVLEQVGEDPLEAQLVDAHQSWAPSGRSRSGISPNP